MAHFVGQQEAPLRHKSRCCWEPAAYQAKFIRDGQARILVSTRTHVQIKFGNACQHRSTLRHRSQCGMESVTLRFRNATELVPVALFLVLSSRLAILIADKLPAIILSSAEDAVAMQMRNQLHIMLCREKQYLSSNLNDGNLGLRNFTK